MYFPGEYRSTGRTQIDQAIAGDALAHVERQNHIQREFFEAYEIDTLLDAVVSHVEVARTETPDKLTVVRDEHIDAYCFDAAGECRVLRPHNGDRDDQEADGHHCSRHRHGWDRRNGRHNCSSSAAVFRPWAV